MKTINRQTSFKLSLRGMALVNSKQALTMNSGLSYESEDGIAGIYREIVSSKIIPRMRLDNFRRAGEKARLAMLGSLLAFADAGSNADGDTAVIGWGGEESVSENRAYFTDYAVNGRLLGRSRLFIGTLPSTPLCEAAICLNLHGPVFYLQSDCSLDSVLAEAESLLPAKPRGQQALLLGISCGALLALLLEPAEDVHDFSRPPQTDDMRRIYHHLEKEWRKKIPAPFSDKGGAP
jgi:hypothetical protein